MTASNLLRKRERDIPPGVVRFYNALTDRAALLQRLHDRGLSWQRVKIAGEPVEKLLEVLKTPEDDVRTRAKIELSKHDSAKVIAATKKWLAGLSKTDKDYEHNRLEGLWVHQWHNVVDEALLKDVLKSPDHRARAAATRVLCYWRDRVPGALHPHDPVIEAVQAPPHSGHQRVTERRHRRRIPQEFRRGHLLGAGRPRADVAQDVVHHLDRRRRAQTNRTPSSLSREAAGR